MRACVRAWRAQGLTGVKVHPNMEPFYNIAMQAMSKAGDHAGAEQLKRSFLKGARRACAPGTCVLARARARVWCVRACARVAAVAPPVPQRLLPPRSALRHRAALASEPERCRARRPLAARHGREEEEVKGPVAFGALVLLLLPIVLAQKACGMHMFEPVRKIVRSARAPCTSCTRAQPHHTHSITQQHRLGASLLAVLAAASAAGTQECPLILVQKHSKPAAFAMAGSMEGGAVAGRWPC